MQTETRRFNQSIRQTDRQRNRQTDTMLDTQSDIDRQTDARTERKSQLSIDGPFLCFIQWPFRIGVSYSCIVFSPMQSLLCPVPEWLIWIVAIVLSGDLKRLIKINRDYDDNGLEDWEDDLALAVERWIVGDLGVACNWILESWDLFLFLAVLCFTVDLIKGYCCEGQNARC